MNMDASWGWCMNSSKPKIIGVNHSLCEVNGSSGVFYFELNQQVSSGWERAFFKYLTTYKPIVFSLYSPSIVSGKLIRAHADFDGAWGIENVLHILQAMVNYANIECNHTAVISKDRKHLREADGMKKFNSRLSKLNYQ